jgi:hypothetical protein
MLHKLWELQRMKKKIAMNGKEKRELKVSITPAKSTHKY